MLRGSCVMFCEHEMWRGGCGWATMQDLYEPRKGAWILSDQEYLAVGEGL